MIGKLDADLSLPVRQSAYCSVAKEHMGIATAAENKEGFASLVKVLMRATRPLRPMMAPPYSWLSLKALIGFCGRSRVHLIGQITVS